MTTQPKEENELTQLELLELFHLVDLDHGGTIDREELRSLLVKIKLPATEEMLERIIDQIDLDKNGEIDPHEFIEGFRRQAKCNVDPFALKAHFSRLARRTNPYGMIGFEELKTAMMNYCTNPISEEEADQLARMMLKPGEDHTAMINYIEFADMMSARFDDS
eukprot:gnl/Trimastix_PCT/3059.p1 GENE.gnl/Trimastix_PCT/3059~~gnl/Trimastix_PCT/3059.p1  ORF type:complete len:163 (+),score=27.02 gnl/Trimastix_PCT/3059:72-560(+)